MADQPLKLKRGTYIVWSPDGEAPPKVSFPTHGAAHFAAKQMAKKHPGQAFMVMQKSGGPICHWPADLEPPAASLAAPSVASSPSLAVEAGESKGER